MQKLRSDRLVLILIIFFLIFTPLFIYLLSLRFRAQDLFDMRKISRNNPIIPEAVSPLDELKKNLAEAVKSSKSLSNTSSSTSISGPYLHLKLNIEGRDHDQSTRLYVGIAPGNQIVNNPVYILSFLVDVPVTGQYTGISLSGIDIGAPYVAYLKGATQITAAEIFNSQSTLNDLGTVDLLSGDLNEDNAVDNNDSALLKQLFGTTPTSPNWNRYADFNSDGIVNIFDLVIINRNLGKTGDSGIWLSSPLKKASTPGTLGVATGSGTIDSNSPSATGSSDGYWLWIPKY